VLRGRTSLSERRHDALHVRSCNCESCADKAANGDRLQTRSRDVHVERVDKIRHVKSPGDIVFLVTPDNDGNIRRTVAHSNTVRL